MRYRFYLWLVLSLGFAVSACDQSRVDGSGATGERTNAADDVLARLERTVVPVINFQDIPIEEVIDFLRMRYHEVEAGEPERGGVSWIIKSRMNGPADGSAEDLGTLEPDQVPKINYSAKDVGLLTAIQEIARQAHLDVYLTNVGMVICKPGESPLPVGKMAGEEVWKTIHKEVLPQMPKTRGEQVVPPPGQ